MATMPEVIPVPLEMDSSGGNSNASVADDIFDHGSATDITSPGEVDPVCIVGMACRLPGQIYSPSDLWRFLLEKKTAMTPVYPQRFNIDGFYHPKGQELAGAIAIGGGYFIQEDIREFENGFFGINNLEATYMDPQQRKLLEVVYECFESAGVTMEQMNGTSTGVYVANFTSDFQVMQGKDPDYYHRYHPTGSGLAIMSNRVSHAFNLQGPSMTIDTACSSSIYALHHAVTAIAVGDCDQAIVAGANLIQSPEQHIGTAKGGFLSPTSTCHTFDTSADGYGRGEAVNAILVKRLSAALRDGDKISAVIRSTAINANGKTPGITLPDATLQAQVIQRAYQKAGLNPADTDFIECHGTGTPVGDPIEVDALSRIFRPRAGPPLLIGSVKTNLGHSEAASGLTSIIKVACAFEHDKIPPSRGVVNINPKLKLEERTMKVATDPEAWPKTMRRASINSFGYGGANGHVILESLDSYQSGKVPKLNGIQDAQPQEEQFLVLPVSAASSKALEARVQQVTDLVAQGDANTVRNLAFTLGQRRSHLRNRKFLVAKTQGMTAQLELQDQAAAASASQLPFAFVFTGQGAQYAGMGKELLLHNEKFRSTIRELDNVLKALPAEYAPTWTLEQAILDPPATSQVNKVTHSQPLCTAIQIGVVRLLRSWGVTAASVVGHSSGEIAAAYAAGLLTASQAILAAYFRGYAAGQLKIKGQMMAAALRAEDAKALIAEKGLEGQARVACVNAPESVTLSGSIEAIDKLQAAIQEQGKFNRKLETGGRAYHSHMMTEIGDLYQGLLAPWFEQSKEEGVVDLNKQFSATMYSSVGMDDGNLRIMDSDVDMAAYWRENLEQPVQFNAALSNLTKAGKHHLIEVGPHSALQGPIKAIRTNLKLNQDNLPYSPSLDRKTDATLSMAKLAGGLFVQGYPLNWAKINRAPSGAKLEPLQSLQPYPWDYSAGLLWNEPRVSVELRNRKYLRHELLGVLAPAGSGAEWNWRNELRLSDMPWMKDHKVEAQVVFPGAGYLATAIEALCQASGLRDKYTGASVPAVFEFRNVNISAALVLQEKGPKTELHTAMAMRKISTATASADWYDFSISSWVDGQTTKHCTGSIKFTEQAAPLSESDASVPVIDEEGYDVWGMARWYERSAEEGLNFGPAFQSLTTLRTDGNRVNPDAVSTTLLQPPVAKDGMSHYPMHPITIDACFQGAIMGGTAGNLRDLRAWLPVFISEIRIHGGGSAATEEPEEAKIHTQVFNTGVSSRSVNCTVRKPSGGVAIDMKNLRLALYTGKTAEQQSDQDDIYLQRHPCLRVHWRPDITRLHPDGQDDLRAYLSSFVAKLQSQNHPDLDLAEDESLALSGAILDLVGHKNPQMRVLELGSSCDCKGKQLLSLLDKETAFPRCRTWHNGNLDKNGDLFLETDVDMFDAVLIPRLSAATEVWEQIPDRVVSLLSDDGVIVTRKTDAAVAGLKAAGFTVLEVDSKTLLAVNPPKTSPALENRKALIVIKDASPAVKKLGAWIQKHLQTTIDGVRARVVSLDQLTAADISENVVCISLLELEREFLATVSPEDMDRLRLITDVVTDLVWLTGANMLGAVPDPNLTLSNGLSRALMLEQPSLRYSILDVGPVKEIADLDATCENIIRALFSSETNRDAEFIQRGNILYVSRFGPDWDINALFRRRLVNSDETIQPIPLKDLGPAKLAIGQIGVTDTMHFQQLSQLSSAPPAGFVDVDLKAVSLNAKDIYAISGRVETNEGTVALDFAGVVSAVGPDVKHLSVGDRVVVWAPNHFYTTERVPVGCVHKMLPNEEFTVLPALLTVQATVLYALRDRAKLQAGESILIHGGAGAFGVAAIAYAQSIGATVYTTVGSKAKREFLTETLNVPAENIFNSRDATFVDGIKSATMGRGVDVIVNSLVGDLLHASWSNCLADFGRFVEIGKRDLVDAGKLDMDVFLRGCTFTAFDLSTLFHANEERYRDTWNSLMADVIQLYREGKIQPAPITTFDVSEIAQAYRHFHNRDRVGKLVISMENPSSLVPAAPAMYRATFDPKKVYLMVGCLGGLGRSLSRWMMSRGARNFVFLGRSGCDKPSAATLVSRLRHAGANVIVVRGDVVQAADVQAAVDACRETGLPVGGVVQAAMGLHEALFCRMTNKAWHTGIQPKWRGTWNLHNSLAADDLDKHMDFFLLTSSISGSVGTATESNYCSANGFLDAFARWRRSQGKPAVSVGLGMISEVGYLHENPDIEALLLRKGIQPLNEDEFLQVIDIALAGASPDQSPLPAANEDPSTGHILTGLEAFSMRKLLAQGFDVSNGTIQDPRGAVLTASLVAEQDAKNASSSASTNLSVTAAPWMKEIPSSLTSTFAPEGDAPSLLEAITRLTVKRFSNLILMPRDQVDVGKPLPQFGVDSMLAAEFRTWFWSSFKVDVPFLDLMSQQKTLGGLSEFVEEKLVASWKA